MRKPAAAFAQCSPVLSSAQTSNHPVENLAIWRLANDLPVSGGGRPCRASDRTTGREERGRSPRVATVGDRAMVDLAPVRCSGGFDRKRGSPGSLPRPCGFPIVRPTSTFADDRISPILNSRMSSSRESSRRGLRSRAAIEAPSAIEQEIGLRPEAAACISVSALSHATSRTPTGDSAPPSSQPISVRANRRMPHRTLR